LNGRNKQFITDGQYHRMYVNIVYFDLLLLSKKNLNLSITRSQNADDAQGHLDFENAFRTCYM
jgi:hypothetical protein